MHRAKQYCRRMCKVIHDEKIEDRQSSSQPQSKSSPPKTTQKRASSNTSCQSPKRTKTSFDFDYDDDEEDENSHGETDKSIDQEIIDELNSYFNYAKIIEGEKKEKG